MYFRLGFRDRSEDTRIKAKSRRKTGKGRSAYQLSELADLAHACASIGGKGGYKSKHRISLETNRNRRGNLLPYGRKRLTDRSLI